MAIPNTLPMVGAVLPSFHGVDFNESDAEDEVDQLDSDSTSEPAGGGSTGQWGGTVQHEKRIPGQSLLPTQRLENIIQADGVTGNLSLSKEGLFVLSIATEEFIKKLVKAGHCRAGGATNPVSYRDMSMVAQREQEFTFLQDTIPYPVHLDQAVLWRTAREKELLEEDPAMATFSEHPPAHNTASSGNQSASKGKAKSRSSNGKINGGSSSTQGSHLGSKVQTTPVIDGGTEHLAQPAAANGAWTTSEAANRQRQDYQTIVPQNGHDLSRPGRSGTITPVQSRGEPTKSPSPQATRPSTLSANYIPEDTWPGQLTGPGSAFLQDPRGPFARPGQDPGRTIYTQHSRPPNP